MNIRQQTAGLFRALGNLLCAAASRIHQSEASPQSQKAAKWFADEGDYTLRLNYPLGENSLVFDLGGYRGQWSSDIFAKYSCQIHVFEPVDEFAEAIKVRFARNQKIFVHQFGLADRNQIVKIGLAHDCSSAFKPTIRMVEGTLIHAASFLQENNIQAIDLMKINIEGGEYDLLEHLIESGCISRIRNIQVQFHDFVPGAKRRMAMIQDRLARTHYPTYQYTFVWENWRLKD